MSEPFVGQMALFPYNFVPRNWAQCNGQLLNIASNTALFSLLGTTYGGNGTTNFALPNLPGQVTVGQGQLPGGGDYVAGQSAGAGTVTLSTATMPSHSHRFPAFASPATTAVAAGSRLAQPSITGRGGGAVNLYTNAGASAGLRADAIAIAGGSGPHNNMQPYLVLNWCIALQGIYPQRP